MLVAPAMNTGMWTAEATRENVRILRERGVHFVGPGNGLLACGDSGDGRMSEPEEIAEAIGKILAPRESMRGWKILVTAGATRERLDPVRFLTNDSSGKMGFALAEAARDRGAEVTLVKAATTAEAPGGVRIVEVESTADLLAAMERECPAQDAVIQAAAVADYRPAEQADRKIKKQAGEEMVIRLVENPDVARTVGEKKRPGQILVGFAAETDHVTEHATAKLAKKHLDMIVANDVTLPGAGFGTDTNIASLITAEGITERPLQSKRALAEDILEQVLAIRKKQEKQ